MPTSSEQAVASRHDEAPEESLDAERADLLETLGKHRYFLRFAVTGLTDEQAALHPTASELCLGGIVKHLALVERGWADFIEHGPAARAGADPAAMEAHAAGFRMEAGDSLQDLLDRYESAAQRTDALVRSLPSLDASQPLPEAPWFTPGTRWTARRVLLHILAETAQHAGHADIIRESIDGQKTMG
ncbi:MAG TPA: DinB family protein [Acidimicrobiales bacterium]|nr:DinB family protein [Acidimicrobiales bacterium]